VGEGGADKKLDSFGLRKELEKDVFERKNPYCIGAVSSMRVCNENDAIAGVSFQKGLV
jgi:hypothetical protein